LPSRGDALLALGFLEDRDECRGQGAFSEESAKQVGDLEGQEEGVSHRPSTHEGSIGNLCNEEIIEQMKKIASNIEKR
jgi:hypothetical protein